MTWHPPFQPSMAGLPAYSSPPLQEASGDAEQAADVASQNGDFLLQLLKSGGGCEDQQTSAEHHDSGFWQLHDPAVAALGPSHSFPMGPPIGDVGPQQIPARPPFIPHHLRFGWSPPFQQDHLFPSVNENPFLTPTDHGFLHPFALQVERPFHPPVPYPFPPQVDPFQPMIHSTGEHVVGPMPQPGPPLQHGSAPVFGCTLELSDAKSVSDSHWQAIQERTLLNDLPRGLGTPLKSDKQQEHKPAPQFYGNGAELLQLLQGGPGRLKAAGDAQHVTGENVEAVADASKTSQRGSPSTAHGPIGPPKRQAVSSPRSPNDLLGRFWAALPSSQAPHSGQEEITSSNQEQDSCAETENGMYERRANDSHRPCHDLSSHGESGGRGFSLLKRGASKLPLDGFEYHESRMNDSLAEKQRSSQSSSTHGRSQEGFYNGRYGYGEMEFDSGTEEIRGNSRRRSSGRLDIRRGGTRGTGGQWVAVNEKHRDVDGLDSIHGDAFDNKDEDYKSANGTHSKMRDELKRRRRQQEWRIKHSHSPTESKSDSKLPKARPLASQLEHPGLPSGSTQDSAIGAALEESKQKLHNGLDSSETNLDKTNHSMKKEELLSAHMRALDLDDYDKGDSKHEGKNQPSYKPRQRVRESRRVVSMHRRELPYRADLQKFTSQLIALYNDLMPTEEEESRRREFLSKLESLVEREWPGARLFLFGSCVNAFGVCNSDIDVCLTVDEEEPNKVELVLKMAKILDSDNMLNVQALTHARVPIVKFTDPVTGISCDICVNNMLAVVNSKLLHDYAQIDVRLRQLAFMVKHWARRRQVNETYRGTLSSYAYVLMCIHFLQQRRPPILPCLQEMPATYEVKVGHIQCAYFDQVETLRDFGANNKETLGELLTSFFKYWAYRHDYNHDVISVRIGGYLSKDEKDWTRRIGNERHLICIEDPFEVSHDLGRVVDKDSIKALRTEFYRAANILTNDANPCGTLFEPYIRE